MYLIHLIYFIYLFILFIKYIFVHLVIPIQKALYKQNRSSWNTGKKKFPSRTHTSFPVVTIVWKDLIVDGSESLCYATLRHATLR